MLTQGHSTRNPGFCIEDEGAYRFLTNEQSFFPKRKAPSVPAFLQNESSIDHGHLTLVGISANRKLTFTAPTVVDLKARRKRSQVASNSGGRKRHYRLSFDCANLGDHSEAGAMEKTCSACREVWRMLSSLKNGSICPAVQGFMFWIHCKLEHHWTSAKVVGLVVKLDQKKVLLPFFSLY